MILKRKEQEEQNFLRNRALISATLLIKLSKKDHNIASAHNIALFCQFSMNLCNLRKGF